MQKIFTGMDNGPEAIEKNFEELQGNVKQAGNVSEWVKNGFVYPSEADMTNSAPCSYKTIDLANGKRLVDLFVILSSNGRMKVGQEYTITVPDQIKHSGWAMSAFHIFGGDMTMTGNEVKIKPNNSSTAFGRFMYIAN